MRFRISDLRCRIRPISISPRPRALTLQKTLQRLASFQREIPLDWRQLLGSKSMKHAIRILCGLLLVTLLTSANIWAQATAQISGAPGYPRATRPTGRLGGQRKRRFPGGRPAAAAPLSPPCPPGHRRSRGTVGSGGPTGNPPAGGAACQGPLGGRGPSNWQRPSSPSPPNTRLEPPAAPSSPSPRVARRGAWG